jgi:hypothetical protein
MTGGEAIDVFVNYLVCVILRISNLVVLVNSEQ